MTTQHPDEHAEVSALLPWYAQDALPPSEREAVARHLERCAACREELEQCRRLGAAFEAREAAAWQPSDAHFNQLLALLDAAGPTPARPAAPRKPRRPWLAALREWLDATPAGVRWTLAAETFALAGLAFALALPPAARTPAPGALYETYSSEAAAPAAPAARGPRLRVVFAPGASEAELRGLLRSIRGQFVQGPSAIGVYTVELPAGAGPDQAVQALRGSGKVTLAEPVAQEGGK